jgi:hypothetical protein
LAYALILAMMSCFPVKSRTLLIITRGYARAAMLVKLLRESIPFVLRAKSNILVYCEGKAKALGLFHAKQARSGIVRSSIL